MRYTLRYIKRVCCEVIGIVIPDTRILILTFILALVLAYSGMSAAAGQNSHAPAGKSHEEVLRLWSLVGETSDRISRYFRDEDDLSVVTSRLEQDCGARPSEHLQASALQAEAREIDARNGLEFRGGYTSQDFNDDDDYPRSYLELSWDVLRNGYRQNNKRAQALYRESEIARLRYQQKEQLYGHRCRRLALGSLFMALRGQLLTLKLELMEPVYRIERRAYFKGWSFLDDLLVSDEDLRDTRRELEQLSSLSLNDAFGSGELINPPIIDVRIDRVIEAINQDGRDDKMVALRQEALRYRRQSEDRNRLRLFVRQELDIAGEHNNNDDLVAGLRFQVPLEWPSSKKDSLPYRLQEVEADVRLSKWERVARTRSAYVEVREQHRWVVRQQYRFLRAQERLRQVKVEKKLGEEKAEVALAIARARTLLNNGIEITRAKEELYRRVYDLFLTARIPYESGMMRVNSALSGDYRARTGSRGIYLWSKTFNHVPNTQLLDFLQAKSANRVFLSAGRKTDRSKLQAFLNRAEEQSVSVEIIVGDNSWIFPDKQQEASIAAAAAAELTGILHLDIEPHTLSGYKTNRELYLDYYMELMRRVREKIGDRQLSLAVPLHWPEHYYQELGKIADHVYLMAYEIPDIDKLIRKIKKVLKNLPPGKAVVVLRMDDFRDQWELEQVVDRIAAKTGIRQFGIHKLGNFLGNTGGE